MNKKNSIFQLTFMTGVFLVCFFQAPKAQEILPLVCYFGDSITEGWIDAEKHPELAYPFLTDSLLRSTSISFRSFYAGKAGETTDDALERIDREILTKKPSVVVIAFGSNDYYIHGGAKSPRTAIHVFRKNLELLCRKIRGINAIPLLLGLPPVIEERFYKFSPASLYIPFGGAAEINRIYDGIIKETASLLSVPYVACDFSVSGQLNAALGFDGIHPTSLGHFTIAKSLEAIIRNNLNNIKESTVYSTEISVYPSPFHRNTDVYGIIKVNTKQTGEIYIEILNILGKAVTSLSYSIIVPGEHFISWKGIRSDGTMLAKGSYTLRIKHGDLIVTKNIIVQ